VKASSRPGEVRLTAAAHHHHHLCIGHRHDHLGAVLCDPSGLRLAADHEALMGIRAGTGGTGTVNRADEHPGDFGDIGRGIKRDIGKGYSSLPRALHLQMGIHVNPRLQTLFRLQRPPTTLPLLSHYSPTTLPLEPYAERLALAFDHPWQFIALALTRNVASAHSPAIWHPPAHL
jgi:hypothetical protein